MQTIHRPNSAIHTPSSSMHGMDLLSGLLDSPRATQPFLLKVILRAPWSMRIQDQSPLTVMALTEGHAWITPTGGLPRKVTAGDIVLARGSSHYLVADEPSTPPQVVIHPGQICTTPDGRDLAEEMGLGVRTWGNVSRDVADTHLAESADSEVCRMLVGVYETQPEVGAHFVSALPEVSVISPDEHRSPLVGLLAHELSKDGPGQSVVLNRLLDLVVISMARIIFARGEQATPGWFLAQSDPVVGPALQAITENPRHPWQVEELAARSAVSRATFAHRFRTLVGESPIAFLTEWRLSVAADLLRSGTATVAQVAEEVGYRSPYAFSAAFKRARRVSPRDYRLRGDAQELPDGGDDGNRTPQTR